MNQRANFKLKPNGKLPIHMDWKGAFQKFNVVGGPFDHFVDFDDEHKNAFGVCVRAEYPPENDVHLAIKDFDVPKEYDLPKVKSAIRQTLKALLDGKNVYVGCMGGWGRTGLFMALLAKVTEQHADPIQYVRTLYTPKAVETKPQQNYVSDFDVRELRAWFRRECWKKRLSFWRR